MLASDEFGNQGLPYWALPSDKGLSSLPPILEGSSSVLRDYSLLCSHRVCPLLRRQNFITQGCSICQQQGEVYPTFGLPHREGPAWTTTVGVSLFLFSPFSLLLGLSTSSAPAPHPNLKSHSWFYSILCPTLCPPSSP